MEIAKQQNMLPIKLFRLVFCLFRFNRNIETLCFGIEAKQPKQTFCFGQCRNQFRFQFRLFRIETSFEGHPSLGNSTMSVYNNPIPCIIIQKQFQICTMRILQYSRPRKIYKLSLYVCVSADGNPHGGCGVCWGSSVLFMYVDYT